MWNKIFNSFFIILSGAIKSIVINFNSLQFSTGLLLQYSDLIPKTEYFSLNI